MSLEAAIQAKLLATSELTDLVAQSIAFGSRIQGDELPGVAWEITSDEQSTLSRDEIRKASVMIYSVDPSTVGALLVATAVQTALEGWTGTADDRTIHGTSLVNSLAEPPVVGEGDDDSPAIVASEWIIWHGGT